MWSNIKTVVEKHTSSENVYLTWFILLLNDHYEVATYLSRQTNEQTKSIQEVVSSEVSTLITLQWTKNRRSNSVFSTKKRLEKRKRIHRTHHASRRVVLIDWSNRFISSARIFSISLKIFIMERRKLCVFDYNTDSKPIWV